MRECPNCGHQNPTDALVCAHCGACVYCGHQNPAGTIICARCGSPLDRRPQPRGNPLDNRPQPTEQETTGCGLGILLGIAYPILAVIILQQNALQMVFGVNGLLLMGLGFLGLAIFFLAQRRTRSIGCGMLIGLVALLIVVIGAFFLALQHGSPVGPIA